MNKLLATASLAFAALTLATAAHAAGMLTASDGMTLYIFDKDAKDTSNCYDACAKLWPPYLATGDQAMGEGWSEITRKDGSKQWAYDGKPLYFYAEDKKAGEAKGEGFKGVWHTVME